MQPSYFEPASFPDHALLDSGHGEKLERFGPVVLRRPDPQALWEPRLDRTAWGRADLSFEREESSGGKHGRWRARKGAPRECLGEEPEWTCRFGDATFLVRPTPFKHVGLFPEQAANWAWLRELVDEFEQPPRLLNLFGYTGAASVVAAQAGWSVTHVDASRSSVSWTLDNAEASGLGRDGMRVLVEDAQALAAREVRRGSRYNAVLLDPPHYGRGPKGEVWRLEQDLAPLVAIARELLDEQALLLLSCYAVGLSPLALAGLVDVGAEGESAVGELVLPEQESAAGAGDGRLLPAGFCARWCRGLPVG